MTIGRFFYLAKHFVVSRLARRKFRSVGEKLSFSPENSVFRYPSISIGKHVFIGREAIFSCEAEIGDYVIFGPRVYITSGRHEYTIVGKRIRDQGEAGVRKVVIEDDCWIGESSLICRGVRIGEGTVVGGMSVVSKSLPPYCICVGSPCHPIKLRYSDAELEQHMTCLGFTAEQAQAMVARRRDELTGGGYQATDTGMVLAASPLTRANG